MFFAKSSARAMKNASVQMQMFESTSQRVVLQQTLLMLLVRAKVKLSTRYVANF